MDSKHNRKYRIKSLYIKGRMIYRKTPACFRCIFLPLKLISKLIRITVRLIRILRLDLWIITGEEITSKQKLAIIYLGNEENKNYLVKLAFDSSYRENYIGRIWIWEFFKKVKEKDHNCSLMVAEVPKAFRILFEKKNCFYIPCWVSGEVDISVDTSLLIRNRSLKSDLSKIRRNNLNFEVTNELSQFYDFYHNMHLPYITKVHGNRAIVKEYDFMKKKFKNCDLLLIKKEEEYIAGSLLIRTKNGIRLWYLGLKDGNMDYMKDGAIGALYYFPVLYLKEKGYKRVNFGLSRSFLKDGALQYKKKWRMQIIGTFGTGILIKPLLKTPGVKGFLLNNPFIYMDKMRFNGAIFAESDQPFSEKDFRKIYRNYHLRGMSKLVIYRFGESGSRTQEIVPAEFKDKVTIRSAESLF